MRAAMLVQIALMVALPFVLAAALRRRWPLSWGLWAAGAVTFVGSQVLHLPFNAALEHLGWIGRGRSLALNAVFYGLSAGVFEEGARYMCLRFWRRDARSAPQALMLGAGHGGIESAILGAAAGLVLAQVVMIDRMGIENLGLPSDQTQLIALQIDQFDALPVWVPFLVVAERLFTMAMHLAGNVLAAVAVVKRRPLWLVGAVAWHAIFDGVMVWVGGRYGPLAIEAWLGCTVPASILLMRLAARQLPSHAEVVPPRRRPVSSGAPVELMDVEKSFGKDVRALRGISFMLRRGERACLLGPNGAGKTTTIRMLTGALSPGEGWAFLYGASADEPEFLAAKRRVGVVPQQPGMYKDMTVRQYLELVRELYAAGDVDEVVARLDMGDWLERSMATLSGGMQRRLSLAAALISSPDLLILDEPSAGLDPIAAREMIDLLASVTKDTTTLLCTHNLAEAEELCDSVIILRGGKVLVHEPIADLRARTTTRLALRAADGPGRLAEALRGEGLEPTLADGQVEVALPNAESGAPALLRRLLGSGLEVCECKIVRPTLEDLFLQIVREAPPPSSSATPNEAKGPEA